MSEHSPTPWRLHNRIIVFGAPEDETNVAEICGSMSNPEVAADAAFIVQAVNAYAEMVEALTVVRMSAGWQIMSAETRALVESALSLASQTQMGGE